MVETLPLIPVEIDPTGEHPVVVPARLLAHESTRAPDGPRASRWTEILIARSEDGQYLGVEIGRSLVEREVDLYGHVLTQDPFDLMRFFERPSRSRPGKPPTLTVVAADALQKAAAMDSSLAEAIVRMREIHGYAFADTAVGSRRPWAAYISIGGPAEHGAPVVAGTTLLVSVVLAALGEGEAPSAVAQRLRVPLPAIAACAAFAADLLRDNRAALTISWRGSHWRQAWARTPGTGTKRV